MRTFIIRLSLFVIGILFQSVAALDLMFELNLVPIHTRTAEHYAQAFAVRMPFILFTILPNKMEPSFLHKCLEFSFMNEVPSHLLLRQPRQLLQIASDAGEWFLLFPKEWHLRLLRVQLQKSYR